MDLAEIISQILKGSFLAAGVVIGLWMGNRNQNKTLEYERKRCDKLELRNQELQQQVIDAHNLK